MTADRGGPQPRMYEEFAAWFHLLTAPHEYAEEAALYAELLDGAGEVHTVLELGSGGGNNASHLRSRFRMTLTDRSPAMLELSRTINPDCEHLVADLRTLRLDTRFDAVFLHDAVSYLCTEDDLVAGLRTAAHHLRPGGVVLVCPDDLRETFTPGTAHGGHDEGARGLRYLEWTWDPDPTDTTYVADYAFLLRDGDHIEVAHDRHVLGLFARERWLACFDRAGFTEVATHPGPEGTEVFLAVR